MGDVAGIGPEVIAPRLARPALHALARPMVDRRPGGARTRGRGSWHPATNSGPGRRCARGGRPIAAHDPLLAGAGDPAICPRSGRGRSIAGPAAPRTSSSTPRSTWPWIVASTRSRPSPEQAGPPRGRRRPPRAHRDPRRTLRRPDHAMMLYLETDRRRSMARSGGFGPGRRPRDAPRRACGGSSTCSAEDADPVEDPPGRSRMRPLTGGRRPRIAVTSLNPHAGEDGLFGDEEQTIIRPAVEAAQGRGVDVPGPFAQRHALLPRPGRRVRRRGGDVPRPGAHRPQDRSASSAPST